MGIPGYKPSGEVVATPAMESFSGAGPLCPRLAARGAMLTDDSSESGTATVEFESMIVGTAAAVGEDLPYGELFGESMSTDAEDMLPGFSQAIVSDTFAEFAKVASSIKGIC